MARPPALRAASSEPKTRRGWLISGLILFAYVTTHLLNHAFGLFGLDAMNAGQTVFLAIWRNPVGTVALYGALALHFYLALRLLYRRRSLRMRKRDAIQLILGLAIPPLLAGHAIDTRLANELYGTIPTYARVVFSCWNDPLTGVAQTVLLLIAWTHGCLGIYFWLRLKPWYARVAPVMFALALLVPVFALLGFLEALREVGDYVKSSGMLADILAATREPAALAAKQSLHEIAMAARGALGLSLVGTLVARHLRNRYERRHRSIRIFYPGGRVVRAPIGHTVLEFSRLGNIPHASVCGGRGRCSTCRVRVLEGSDFLPVAGAEEAALLKRVGAAADVRLACQLRPIDDLAVMPLLPAGVSARDIGVAADYLQGGEREICVLFADLRGFTRFAERKLPYDVVFFLNRYFDAMGGAIERAGGVTNQFTGDGVMALFGLESGPEQGCRDAFAAAAAMVQGLAELSAGLAAELSEPLKIGIGIHVGPTVVGRMGRGVAMYLTAVGDTVHVASRLQDLTKQYKCQMVVSELAAARAGIDVRQFPRDEIEVRNRAERVAIRTIEDVAELGIVEAATT
jgi:adenylate cyclase